MKALHFERLNLTARQLRQVDRILFISPVGLLGTPA